MTVWLAVAGCLIPAQSSEPITIRKLRVPRELIETLQPKDQIIHRTTEERVDALIRQFRERSGAHLPRRPVAGRLEARFDEKTGTLAGTATWRVPEGRAPVIELFPWSTTVTKVTIGGHEPSWGLTPEGKFHVQASGTGTTELEVQWEKAGESRQGRWTFELALPQCAVAELALEVPTDWKLRSTARVVLPRTPSDPTIPLASPGTSGRPGGPGFDLLFSGEPGLAIELIPPQAHAQGWLSWQTTREYRFDPSGIDLSAQIEIESLHERADVVELVFDERIRLHDLAVNTPGSWQARKLDDGRTAWTLRFRSPPLHRFRIDVRRRFPPATGSTWQCPELVVADAMDRGEIVTYAVSPALAIRGMTPGRFELESASLGNDGWYQAVFRGRAGTPGADRPRLRIEPVSPAVEVTCTNILDLTQPRPTLHARMAWRANQPTSFEPAVRLSSDWQLEGVRGLSSGQPMDYRIEPLDETGTLVRLQLEREASLQKGVEAWFQAVPRRFDETAFDLAIPEIRPAGGLVDRNARYRLLLGPGSPYTTEGFTPLGGSQGEPLEKDAWLPIGLREKLTAGSGARPTILSFPHRRPVEGMRLRRRPRPQRYDGDVAQAARWTGAQWTHEARIELRTDEMGPQAIPLHSTRALPQRVEWTSQEGTVRIARTAPGAEEGEKYDIGLAAPISGTVVLMGRWNSDRSSLDVPLLTLPGAMHFRGTVTVECETGDLLEVDAGRLEESAPGPEQEARGGVVWCARHDGGLTKPRIVARVAGRAGSPRPDRGIAGVRWTSTLFEDHVVHEIQAGLDCAVAGPLEIALAPDAVVWSARLDGRPVDLATSERTLLVADALAEGPHWLELSQVHPIETRWGLATLTLGSLLPDWKLASFDWKIDSSLPYYLIRQIDFRDSSEGQGAFAVILPAQRAARVSMVLSVLVFGVALILGWRRPLAARSAVIVMLASFVLMTLGGDLAEALFLKPILAAALASAFLHWRGRIPIRRLAIAAGLMGLLGTHPAAAQSLLPVPEKVRTLQILVPYDTQEPQRSLNQAIVSDADLRLLETASTAYSPQFLIRSARYDGSVHDGQFVRWHAKLDVFSDPKEKLPHAPFAFRGITPVRVTIDGLPASFELQGVEGRQESLDVQLARPGHQTVHVEFTTPILGTGSQRELEFSIPPASSARLELKLDARSRPLAERDSPGLAVDSTAQGTTIAGTLGPTRRISLRWWELPSPPPPREVKVSLAHLLDVDDRTQLLKSTLQYLVQGLPVATLSVDLDPSLVVSAVRGRALRSWQVVDRPSDQRPQAQPTLVLEFDPPLLDTIEEVRLECIVQRNESERVVFPPVLPREARIESSKVAIRIPAGWLVSDQEGRDPTNLGWKPMLDQAVPGRMIIERDVQDPLSLEPLFVRRPLPDWSVRQATSVLIDPAGPIELTCQAELNILSGNVHTIRVRMPPGFEPDMIVADGLHQWYREGREMTLLLKGPIAGGWPLTISGTLATGLAPNRNQAEVVVPLEGFEWVGSKETDSTWRVSVPEGWRAEAQGLTSANLIGRPEQVQIESRSPRHSFRLRLARDAPTQGTVPAALPEDDRSPPDAVERGGSGSATPAPPAPQDEAAYSARQIEVDLLARPDSVWGSSAWEIGGRRAGTIEVDLPPACQIEGVILQGRQIPGPVRTGDRLHVPLIRQTAPQELVLLWSVEQPGSLLQLPALRGCEQSQVPARLRSKGDVVVETPGSPLDPSAWRKTRSGASLPRSLELAGADKLTFVLADGPLAVVSLRRPWMGMTDDRVFAPRALWGLAAGVLLVVLLVPTTWSWAWRYWPVLLMAFGLAWLGQDEAPLLGIAALIGAAGGSLWVLRTWVSRSWVSP